MSAETETDSLEGDAADFLLCNTKYHDCLLIVGNPETEDVEGIGVASLDLIAHSPVFRNLLESNRTKNPESKIHITDVSPAIFRFMLRYVYGGKLPKMTAIEAAGLALCADKFQIPRLLRKAVKRLNPTSADDVFPGLICVTSISLPDLEIQIGKIIQRETEKIVQNPDFLELDEDSVLFILKQDTLNIREVELWASVVCWANYQAEINPARTVRDCLATILGYVRFLTFTSEEILEHVLPTKVLTAEEYMELTLAVTRKQVLESPVLCKTLEKRKQYIEKAPIDKVGKENGSGKEISQGEFKSLNLTTRGVFKVSDIPLNLKFLDDYNRSTLILKTAQSVEIESFTCKSRSSLPPKQKIDYRYYFTCGITFIRSIKAEFLSEEVITHYNEIVPHYENMILPLKLEQGNPVILKPGETGIFHLSFGSPHPIFQLVSSNGHDSTKTERSQGCIKCKFDTFFHVLEIAYKTLTPDLKH